MASSASECQLLHKSFQAVGSNHPYSARSTWAPVLAEEGYGPSVTNALPAQAEWRKRLQKLENMLQLRINSHV